MKKAQTISTDTPLLVRHITDEYSIIIYDNEAKEWRLFATLAVKQIAELILDQLRENS